MKDITCNKCGRPMQYATEPKCNYCDACMSEYCGCKLGRIKEIEPTCDSTAVIPSITVESVEGITNLANCLVHVNDINTTFYVDDKHRVMITWAGPVNIPGYDMENNPNGYRDQIVTDIEKGIAVIYDKHGKGFTFGIYQSLDADGAITQAVNDKIDEMAADGTLADIISQYIGEPIFGFDTVADMKASTTLQVGDRVKTLGFHTINDGGGAYYKITDTGTANEMDVIAIGSLYANLILPTVVSPEMYGAYGDSTHDDTIAVQATLDARRPVKMSKNYLISSQITVGGYPNLDIDASASTITYSGSSSAILIQNIYGAKVSFGSILSDNGNGVELYSTSNSDRIMFLTLSFNRLSCSNKNIYIHNTDTGYINEITFNGGRITKGDYGFYIDSNPTGNSYQLNGYTFNKIAFEGSATNYYINTHSTYIRGFTFVDNRTIEHTESTMFNIVGQMRQSTYTSWSPIDLSRITLTPSDLTAVEIKCPILEETNTRKIADGIYYDRNRQYYIVNYPSVTTLTKQTGIGGAITATRIGNTVILNFNNVTFGSASGTLVSTSNHTFVPTGRVRGTLTSTDGMSALVSIEADGSISYNASAAAVGVSMYGSLAYTTYSEGSY